MAGLRNLCRAYGRMKCGNTVFVWDYIAEEPVPEHEMPVGSRRWQASENARWLGLGELPPPPPDQREGK